MSKFLTKCKEKYVALRGFHTKRHLVVIESDDWGSIRMPSAEVFDKLQKSGDYPEKDAFLRNDCLENEADLTSLFKVLQSAKDSKGMSAVMTANFAMANPDFDKIDCSGNTYAYEPFYETYRKYYSGQDVLSCVKSGIESLYFVPQLHCREHMNVNRWMADLKRKKKDTVTALQNRMIGIGESFSPENPFGYMDAFNANFTSDSELANILREAMDIFENTFGKKSETFVASCFVWNDELEKTLAEIGVLGIQSACWQNVPCGANGSNTLKRRIRYSGQRNRFGHVYSVRNCAYEPAYLQNPSESARICLEQVFHAFKEYKPAVINSHRFNYIGSINPDNASENLKGLSWLLRGITDNVSDVEFISSAELIEIMNQVKK